MARERYLLGDTEETIHKDEIVLTTGKEKRANWWDYHKWIVIVTAIVVTFLGWNIYKAITKVKPDYTVAMMTDYQMPDALQEDIETTLARYGEDLNGDGRVVAEVSHFHFIEEATNETEALELQAAFVRFAADAESGDSMIYIYDPVGEAYFEANDMADYFAPAGEMKEVSMEWKDIPGLNTLVVDRYSESGATTENVLEVLGRLSVSVRAEDGAAFGKESVREYRQKSIELLDRLIRNEPTVQE